MRAGAEDRGREATVLRSADRVRGGGKGAADRVAEGCHGCDQGGTDQSDQQGVFGHRRALFTGNQLLHELGHRLLSGW